MFFSLKITVGLPVPSNGESVESTHRSRNRNVSNNEVDSDDELPEPTLLYPEYVPRRTQQRQRNQTEIIMGSQELESMNTSTSNLSDDNLNLPATLPIQNILPPTPAAPSSRRSYLKSSDIILGSNTSHETAVLECTLEYMTSNQVNF